MADSTKPDQEPALDLVPDFARAPEETGEGGWTKLTDANPDYEKLWAMGPIDVPPPPPEPPPAAPPPAAAPPPSPAPAAGEPSEPPPATPGFTGTLVTGDEVLTASIVVSPERMILWGGGHELGNWTHDQAKIARLTFSRFAIHAESDALTFTADDPSGLDNVISAAIPGSASTPEGDEATPAGEGETPTALPEELPSLAAEPPPAEAELPLAPLPEPARPTEPTGLVTSRRPRIKTFKSGDDKPTDVASHPTPADEAISAAEARGAEAAAGETDPDEVTNDFGETTIADTVKSRRAMTSIKARRFLPADIKDVALKSGAVLILVGVLAGLGLLILLLTRGGDNTPAVNTATTAVPERVVITTAAPTTVPTTAPLPDSTLFQTDAETLRVRWNQLAEVAAPNMILVEDIVSPFILLLAPNISLEGVLDPTAGNVVMRSTPSGTPEGDSAILSALGILIGTADPTLDGNDRRALLGQLGLDVNRPELAGIDGSLTYNGLLYRMVYRQESNSLELAITPEGAPTTTAN